MYGLAGDAEPQPDLGQRVAGIAQAGHSPAERGLDSTQQAAEVCDGVNVSGRDAAGIAAQDAAGECGVLVVFDVPLAAFACQRWLDA